MNVLNLQRTIFFFLEFVNVFLKYKLIDCTLIPPIPTATTTAVLTTSTFAMKIDVFSVTVVVKDVTNRANVL